VDSKPSVAELIADIEPELIMLRRELHAHPELGVDLPWTAQRVVAELTQAGIEFEQVDDGGIVAVIGPRGASQLLFGQTWTACL